MSLICWERQRCCCRNTLENASGVEMVTRGVIARDGCVVGEAGCVGDAAGGADGVGGEGRVVAGDGFWGRYESGEGEGLDGATFGRMSTTSGVSSPELWSLGLREESSVVPTVGLRVPALVAATGVLADTPPVLEFFLPLCVVLELRRPAPMTILRTMLSGTRSSGSESSDDVVLSSGL